MPGRERATSCGEKPCAAMAPGQSSCAGNSEASGTSAASVSRPPASRRSINVDNFPRPVSITSGSIDAQMLGGDQQHIGAMRRQRAAADGAGNDAREIEHLHAGERPIRRTEFLRRRFADLLDAEQWQLRHRLALRSTIPFGERTARGDDEAGFFRRRGFQRFGRHAIERALHRGLVVRHAEQFQKTAAMMRQIGMQPREAAVAAAIQTGEIVVIFVRPVCRRRADTARCGIGLPRGAYRRRRSGGVRCAAATTPRPPAPPRRSRPAPPLPPQTTTAAPARRR